MMGAVAFVPTFVGHSFVSVKALRVRSGNDCCGANPLPRGTEEVALLSRVFCALQLVAAISMKE